MKYNLTLILVCFLFAGLKSQPETLINGTVTDSLGHAVPFATIALSDQSGGTYSDINGQFILKVVQFPVSFIIRNVGYEQKELRIEEPPSSDISIILHEKVTMLREVVVTDTKIKPKMIGSPKSRKAAIALGVSESFEQIGLMVKNENSELYSNPAWLAVWVRIAGGGIFDWGSKPTGEERQLRLRIYSIDDQKGVGEDLLASNVFLSPGKAGWYKVDISHLNLALPREGFVVAVEWLDNQPVREWEFKNDDTVVFYGVDLLGHRLREEEKKYYSTFRFRSLSTGWQKPEHIAERELYAPCIRLEFIEL